MPKEEWQEIQKQAKLRPYTPPPSFVMKRLAEQELLGVPTKGLKYLSVGKTDIGPYSIHIKRSKETCHIRVVENLPEGKSHIVGVWSGDSAICEPKRREVARVIHQVRVQQITGSPPKKEEPKRIIFRHPPPLIRRVPEPPPKLEEVGEVFIISYGGHPVTKKPVPIKTARDVAKSVSAVQFKDIDIVDSQGRVEETYKRGTRTYTRVEHAPPPTGRQFYTPSPERSAETIKVELLAAAKRADTETMARLIKELGG